MKMKSLLIKINFYQISLVEQVKKFSKTLSGLFPPSATDVLNMLAEKCLWQQNFLQWNDFEGKPKTG